jgi:hypothetical protein
MKRSDVRKLVGAVTAPKVEEVEPEPVVIPAPEPVVIPASAPAISDDDALNAWLRSPQGQKLRHLGGVNPDRLHHAYADRVTAIFKAGFAAGLGETI